MKKIKVNFNIFICILISTIFLIPEYCVSAKTIRDYQNELNKLVRVIFKLGTNTVDI